MFSSPVYVSNPVCAKIPGCTKHIIVSALATKGLLRNPPVRYVRIPVYRNRNPYSGVHTRSVDCTILDADSF